MMYGVRVKNASRASPGAAERATLERVRLECSLAPARVLDALRGDELPFALTGNWAGGGAIVGSCPLAIAGVGRGAGPGAPDPFATLDRLPTVGGGRLAGDAVGGGWFGWLGYRLAALVERVPEGPPRPVAMPEHHLAYYDHVLRLDSAGHWWFEALATPARAAALVARLRRLRTLLRRAERDLRSTRAGRAGRDDTGASPRGLAPPALRLSAADAAAHREAVRRCRERIFAGEIFQANLCVRLETRWPGTASELFTGALRTLSPAYGATFDTPGGGIASLSPELFLRRRGDRVSTGPIKGTAERPADPVTGAAALARLRASAKDAAEHVMIVDLMRNDLGRVCAYGSVRAPRRATAEAHPGLWHLVSRVEGRLRPGVGNAELLRATFPPGSVTGAPKVQSLRVIAELERTGREVYTGAIGYASPVAGVELSVAIRTLELGAGRLWLGAGGGIVADSDPQTELEEALVKARPIAAAIGTTALIEQAVDSRVRRDAVHVA
jgi:para-aminobenzoate synthetase/4-amino-4-deoxychorismate lyase